MVQMLGLTAMVISGETLYAQQSRQERFSRESVQSRQGSIQLAWGAPVTNQFSEVESRTFLWFEGASYDATANYLPIYQEIRNLPPGSNSATVELQNAIYEPLDMVGIAVLGSQAASLDANARVNVQVGYQKRQPFAQINVLPIRRNPSSGAIEKLVRFDLIVRPAITATSSLRASSSTLRTYVTNSVLASGEWHRISVGQTGVYKLSYQFFENMGYDMQSIDPRNIRLYGNGRGQLSYVNADAHYDDLNEYAIQVVGESDGVFNETDYVLFYGISPNLWKYDPTSQRFRHSVHQYSDSTYYFVTADLGPGKRIGQQASSALPATHTVNTFDDFKYHEADLENLIKSGRSWYGEKFDILDQYSFVFTFPNIDAATPAWVYTDLVSRFGQAHSYSVSTQSTNATINVPAALTTCYYCPYAIPASTQVTFTPVNPTLNITVARQPVPAASQPIGWLNEIEINVRRQLLMAGSQMNFRDQLSVGAGNVAEYNLGNANPNLVIWDVTNLADIALQQVTSSGNTLQFRKQADTLSEFIAFDGSQFLLPGNSGKVDNQDLHAQQPVDYIIVTHPLFLSQANELAQFHANIDGLRSVVVTPQQIYNEFSSGAQDVTAIRDFIRMLYDKAPTQNDMPKYLLLFGDGSYDNKNRVPGNSNFIPTFQNLNGLNPIESYVSDEFFGLLDDQGEWDDGGDVGFVDIGVGRFPVRTAEEARNMLNKIRRYEANDPISTTSSCGGGQQCSSTGEWRNWITFIGDDEDNNTHISQSNQLATQVDTTYKNYNVEKIFFDAYPQVQTPAGERYPDVTEAIDRRVERGALLINYTGHGGEVGLGHEQAVSVPQINAWRNFCNMPMFVTATCEFSRFDDPSRTSAGELVFLNPDGGGIGLLTTVRLVYAQPNFTLNTNFYRCVFDSVNGDMPRIGDVYLKTKTLSGNNPNNRNFMLIGDPAMRLRYPKNQVLTTQVNQQPVNLSQPDTLRALSLVTISGIVADAQGNKITSFNGVIYPTVFDKPTTVTTLRNDPQSQVYNFRAEKNILYRGKASVVNGEYTFSFVVPRDIAYQYGKGRINYYAYDGQTDASGSYENVIIGGSNPNAPTDVTGPQVRLFMNDTNFVSGGITDQTPILLALISDSNGVNTVGNGIGHDIVAIIDDQTAEGIVLNDYYTADMNSYQSGRVSYPFENLAEGAHTLTIKVWDVYNNSSTVKIEFTVVKNEALKLDHVLNYPNPFTTRTSFFFEHNQACSEFDVMVQVFTVSGKLVKTINEHVHTEGYRSKGIFWDGKDDYGDNIGRGVYVYRLVARSSDGKTAEQYEKLVILN